jgi:hypothetical protein
VECTRADQQRMTHHALKLSQVVEAFSKKGPGRKLRKLSAEQFQDSRTPATRQLRMRLKIRAARPAHAGWDATSFRSSMAGEIFSGSTAGGVATNQIKLSDRPTSSKASQRVHTGLNCHTVWTICIGRLLGSYLRKPTCQAACTA